MKATVPDRQCGPLGCVGMARPRRFPRLALVSCTLHHAWLCTLSHARVQQTIATSALGFPLTVYAMDVDGDNDTDVMSASFLSNRITW
jgi:hypothetical protein